METRDAVLETPLGRSIPYTRVLPDRPPTSVLLFLHGIFSERHEDGRFERLAALLAGQGHASYRFDYLGHGESDAPTTTFTVAGALTDLSLVITHVLEDSARGRFNVVATSFGGSLTLLHLMRSVPPKPDRIVLLNPVADYVTTFLEPAVPDMKATFNASFLRKVWENGAAVAENGFELGLPLLVEFELLKPFQAFDTLTQPCLVVHGDADAAVSHDITRSYALRSPNVRFETIHGGTHSFVAPEAERLAFQLIAGFLASGEE